MSTSATPGDASEARQRNSPAGLARGGIPNQRQAFLFIRLWIPPQATTQAGSLSWRLESSLIQMIADVVSASGGTPAGTRANGLIARFRSIAAGSAAALRLQRAIAGFAAHGTAPAGAAVALFSQDRERGSDLDESSDELETASVLASAAQPAQILLTAAAYADLNQAVPYTSRRAVPFRMPNGTHSNLKAYQLTWNSTASISGERPRAENASPPEQPAAAERTTKKAQSERQPALPNLVEQSAPPMPVDALLRPRAVPLNALPLESSSSPGVIPSGDLKAVPNHSSRRLPLYAGLMALMIAIAAVGAWFLTHRPDASKITPQQPRASVVADPPTAPTRTPNPAILLQPTTTPIPDAPPPPDPEKITRNDQPMVMPSPSPKPLPPAPDKNLASKAPADADGFFRSEIPELLEMADRESGDGKYDAAERHYRIVQRLDPNNRAARLGLARIASARKLEHP
jgi:hypothetical protein